jgi:hypothetical protein
VVLAEQLGADVSSGSLAGGLQGRFVSSGRPCRLPWPFGPFGMALASEGERETSHALLAAAFVSVGC